MRHIAYRRYSPSTPDHPQQLTGLEFGFDLAFVDQCLGNAKHRPGLDELMKSIEGNDVVHVESIDLLARNTRHLLQIINVFQAKEVGLVFHHEKLTFSVELSDQDRGMLKLLKSLASAEDALNLERQCAGISKAKAQGTTLGRPAIDKSPILALIAKGIPGPEIARRLNCSIRTVQRIARELNDQ